jgi:hypothetical protein
MSSSEQRNIPKGFLTLLLIIVAISCGVALAVYAVYIYRVHPELLHGEEPVSFLIDCAPKQIWLDLLFNTLKQSTPPDFV